MDRSTYWNQQGNTLVYTFSVPSNSHKRGRRFGTHDSWWLPQTTASTLMRKSGVWSTQENPAGYDLAGADRIYMGGRTYTLTLAERDELIAAGYSVDLSYV